MDLSELIMNIQQLAPQLASTCCVINGAFMTLEDVEKMGYDEFLYRSKINMPLRLYKYFSNAENDKEGSKVNYSMIALKNNTVYMQSPSLFDDVYDSEINIDYYDYHKYRLLEYCRRCGLPVDESKTIENIGIELLKAIQESVEKNKDFDHIFTVSPTSEIESMSNEIFINKIEIGLSENQDIGQVVSKIISEEYQEYMEELRNTFRISCFATTPYSQLMWGKYADCHNGFCIEYTVLPNDEKYKDLFYNLFPMVYCKTRPNITKELVEWKDRNKNKEYLCDNCPHANVIETSQNESPEYDMEWLKNMLEEYGIEDDSDLIGDEEMLFICYPKCSTCQKAKKWLDEHNIKYTERHIVDANPTYDELKEWYGKSGLPLKKFFNTSGLLYKEMQLKDKLSTMSEEEQLQLLATNGMLVKRPLIVNGDTVLVGFKEAEWSEKLN